tara:strand:+ start:2635 stop:2904 length:270 start_codon:yes stop_codon:yes gene_type:complete
MSNQRKINGKTYEIVSEFYDNGDSSSIAKTIIEEGEEGEGVNTYRIIIASRNPLTSEPFDKDADKLWSYLQRNQDSLWSPYWEDPEPEE